MPEGLPASKPSTHGGRGHCGPEDDEAEVLAEREVAHVRHDALDGRSVRHGAAEAREHVGDLLHRARRQRGVCL